MIDDEKAIVEEKPDYENQLAILAEEHENQKKKRKWYTVLSSILVFIVCIFVVSYSEIHVYREYGDYISNDSCGNVNLRVDGSPVPNLNIYMAKDGDITCKPMFNIDYHNNRKATFNIDVYGDGTFIFNPINQKDADGVCKINCDTNSDGWPDLNIDLNGDGIIDINYDTDNDGYCEKNCDLDLDTIADSNLYYGDIIINEIIKGSTKPSYNLDYMGNKKAVFNIKNSDGTISNPIDVMENGICKYNCDIDNDGFPDYNIRLSENGNIINELINSSEDNTNKYDNFGDWKCHLSSHLDSCHKKVVSKNEYINIDVNGDGIPDVNISNNGGNTIRNKINNNGLNLDINGDGFPDYNIDIDGDGKADINIANDQNLCIENCDFNYDGKAEYYVKLPGSDVLFSINNINIDNNFDTKCDINCDIDDDLIPDYNIDLDNDGIADINIDFDGDKLADYNIDTNNDGKPDKNLDAYGLGICNFNCDGNFIVNSSISCTENCDTDGDGWPDKNVDINHDGVCDFNCGTDDTKDSDHNYYLDKEFASISSILNVAASTDANLYIMNPISIYEPVMDPGWVKKYVIEVKNESYYGIKYNLVWENLINEFSDINNLDYFITRSGASYLNNLKAPRANSIIASEIIKARSTVRYVLEISWKETGINQSIDAGKRFKGNFTIRVVTK